MTTSTAKKKKGKGRVWLVFAAVATLILGWLGLHSYDAIFKSNVSTHGDKTHVCIPTGSSFDEVVNLLISGGFLGDEASFR
ncbi:MAG: hypothetical protein ACKOQY_12315, partial [Bacteroidota bacterium]